VGVSHFSQADINLPGLTPKVRVSPSLMTKPNAPEIPTSKLLTNYFMIYHSHLTFSSMSLFIKR